MTFEQTNAAWRGVGENARAFRCRVLNNQREGIVDRTAPNVRILSAELDEQIALVADIEDTRRVILRIYWKMGGGEEREAGNPGNLVETSRFDARTLRGQAPGSALPDSVLLRLDRFSPPAFPPSLSPFLFRFPEVPAATGKLPPRDYESFRR